MLSCRHASLSGLRLSAILSLTALGAVSCHTVNDTRIPAMPVSIRLDNVGMWNTYGVSGYGEWRLFILDQGVRVPADFAFPYGSCTGYGGVLLICGQDAFTGEVGPLAYDLSCPVEREPGIRVAVDSETLEAVCPDCGSHYNVVAAGGSPVSGVATGLGYGLTRYQCVPAPTGGYGIIN